MGIVSQMLRHGPDLYVKYVLGAAGLLALLLLWQVGGALCKRLWLIPANPPKLLALNAGTLALLSLLAKPATPDGGRGFASDETMMLLDMVLLCAMLGAFVPSIGASYGPNLNDLWSNVVGVSLLVVTAIVTIFLQCYNPRPNYYYAYEYTTEEVHPVIHALLHQHIIVMCSLFLLLLVFLTQVLALKPMMAHVKASVSEQLEQLHMEKKAGYTGSVVMQVETRADWSWERIERNTCIKLMMVLTSDPQNVLTRSPSAAIVGALVLLSITMLATSFIILATNTILVEVSLMFLYTYFYIFSPAVLVCGFISLWRWVCIALHEDRPFQALILDAEPCYWQHAVRNFLGKLKTRARHVRPNVLQEGQYGFKEVLLDTIHFLLLCSLVPLHRMLVAAIRFTHILSLLIMRNLIWLPIKALIQLLLISPFKALWTACPAIFKGEVSGSQNNRPVIQYLQGVANLPLQGVVCLPGEDARIVGQQFASAANRVITRQLKRVHTKPDVKALVSLLHTSEISPSLVTIANRSNGIQWVLSQEGAPHVDNLHVEHGYQYGWGLTIVSLLDIMIKIEEETLQLPEISEGAMDAFWQALEMVKLVDKQYMPCIVCSEDTYATAFASEWSKLRKKKKRAWSQRRNYVQSHDFNLDSVDQVLKSLLEPAKIHIEEFNKTKGTAYVAALWPLETVVAYTKHTVCQNLLRWWQVGSVTNIAYSCTSCSEGGGRNATNIVVIQAMLQQIRALIAELLACCLLSLPTALEMSMTSAVNKGSISKIERGLFVIGQGKHVWGELKWPTTTLADTGFGQLRRWIHLSHGDA